MALQDKYRELIDAAAANGVQVSEQDGVLYVQGEVNSGAAKDQLWSIYDKIDPNFLTGDVVMNVNVALNATSGSAKVTTDRSNLNVRQGPGTDQPIVGKAAHQSTVTVINQTNGQWWLIRTEDGVEGYAYAQYLTLQ